MIKIKKRLGPSLQQTLDPLLFSGHPSWKRTKMSGVLTGREAGLSVP
jgi:hypothetical protein